MDRKKLQSFEHRLMKVCDFRFGRKCSMNNCSDDGMTVSSYVEMTNLLVLMQCET